MARKAQSKEDNELVNTLMLAYLCVKDTKGLAAQVAIVDRFGLPDADIARVCDCTVGAVRNSRLKRKQRGRGNGSAAVVQPQEAP